MSEPTDPPQIQSPRKEETREVASASWLERFFFLRTTFAALFVILLVAGGLFSYLSLTKESLPDLEIPMATVTTEWPGADPQTVEEQVTQEIEDEIATLKGLKTFSSASFDSFSVISVEFEADEDADSAMQSLRDAVADSEASLPEDAEAPSIQQVSVDDRPIMTMALYGNVPEVTLNRFAEKIQDRLETFSGVNEVNLGGARDEIVQILLDPQRLLALGVSPALVRQSVSNANLDQPFGEIRSETIGAVVRLEGQFKTIEDLRNLPITRLGSYENVRPVRLGEVATVERKLETEESRAFFSTDDEGYEKTVEISITKSPGSDTIQVIREIKADLEALRGTADWPNGLSYAITQDNSEDIWDSLQSVFVNGLQAMVAVFIILFLILTWREGLIAGLSIPISFAGTMLAIWLFGYTLNELVIIGMVLALGLLVDVFILMMEGIHDEIYSKKKTFGQAALATVKTYGMPAFAGQLTTILALAPLAAISGISGKFIRVLPVTAISCLVIAFSVALLASVPLSRFLMAGVARRGADVRETHADRVMGSLADRLERWSLGLPLRSRKTAIAFVAGAILLFILSLVAATRIPVTLYPKTDGLTLGINLELPPTTTLDASQEVAEEIGRILEDKPYFDTVIQLVGRKSSYATSGPLEPVEAENFIGYSIRFKEREERNATSYELANDLRKELGAYVRQNIPGTSLVVAEERSGPQTGDPIQIRITGDDIDTLRELSRNVQDLLVQVPGASDVRDNLGSVKAEIALVPIREAVDFFGLTQQDLAAQLRLALSNDPIGTFVTLGPEDDLDIHLGMSWPSRNGDGGSPRTMEETTSVRAFTQNGTTVSIMELLEPRISEAPTSVLHEDGRRAITVLAKVENRSVEAILEDLDPHLEEAAASWPSGFDYSIGGEAEEAAETYGSAGVMLILALILVFGVLVLVFGSFSQAFILMTTMPLALIGTFLGFWLFGFDLSFFAVIGVISLIGIVANNGIVMVDTMNSLLKQGASVRKAAADGAAQRLRPILTTSLTTIFGLVPLALGSPMYAPLCYAIVFGLIMSTVLSLVIVPCLYLLLTSDDQMQAVSLD